VAVGVLHSPMAWAIISTGASIALLVLVLRSWHKQRSHRAALNAELDEALRRTKEPGTTNGPLRLRHRMN